MIERLSRRLVQPILHDQAKRGNGVFEDKIVQKRVEIRTRKNDRLSQSFVAITRH